MQHVADSAFLALSPAKAKAHALAIFDAALVDVSPDWQTVALALHSVVTRKRGAAAAPISDDAGEFVPWADYAATGKAASIARGRVTVTFADGWSRTVGMLAGKTAKGRKPWSIAHAVRFAVICYKLAAARRVTGSDRIMYFDKGGACAGESVTLDGLIAAPEIVSVVSADSSETAAGDLIWNPCEANAFTREQRAGAVAMPELIGPHAPSVAQEMRSARRAMLGRLELERSPLFDGAKAAAARVEALLYPAPFANVHGYDPDELDERAETDLPPADLETMIAAQTIVGPAHSHDVLADIPDFARSVSLVPYLERFRLVEDALIAWPALRVVADPAPAPKPRYRFDNARGCWEIVPALPALAEAA